MNNKKTAVALGYFDGLHLGHMSVINAAIKAENHGFVPSVLLFDEHPMKVLRNADIPALITTEERDSIIKKYGLKIFAECFRDICKLTPEEFFYKILIEKLNAGFISCGFNYTFGATGAGNVELLNRLCKDNGIVLCVADEKKVNGIAVSSTEIRNLLKEGRIEEANLLLGRNFSFEAEVIQGDHRGRTIGSPTINQNIPDGLIVPCYGVYASVINIDGKKYYGVSDIGSRPTFNGSSARCETYILNFDGNLYGKVLKTELIEYIRCEKKFDSVDSLIREIQKNALYVKNKYIIK